MLAKAQAKWVSEELLRIFPKIEISVVEVVTTGDRILNSALSQVPGKGLFVKEIEDKLLAGDIDLAVHSMKDVPTDLPHGLAISAVTKRVDPRDVFISRHRVTLAELPRGARVGTSSLRRQAQLLHFRSDLTVLDIRGNIDTRLKKSRTDEYDGILLAAAGLMRMGWQDEVHEYLSCNLMVPAVGQGALGIETRRDDVETNRIVDALDDRATNLAVAAERVFLDGMGGGCQAPMGAYCRERKGEVVFKAFHASPNGDDIQKAERTGPLAEASSLAEMLVESFSKNACLVAP